MKQLKGWDAYVAEATPDEENRSLELPLTDDEVYIIEYPTRAQGKEIAAAQAEGDSDRLVLALLGETAGQRVVELSQDYPAAALDALLLDVLKKFGFYPDELDDMQPDDDTATEDASTETATAEDAPSGGAPAENGKAVASTGKSRSSTRAGSSSSKTRTTSGRKQSGQRSRSSAA